MQKKEDDCAKIANESAKDFCAIVKYNTNKLVVWIKGGKLWHG